MFAPSHSFLHNDVATTVQDHNTAVTLSLVMPTHDSLYARALLLHPGFVYASFYKGRHHNNLATAISMALGVS